MILTGITEIIDCLEAAFCPGEERVDDRFIPVVILQLLR